MNLWGIDLGGTKIEGANSRPVQAGQSPSPPPSPHGIRQRVRAHHLADREGGHDARGGVRPQAARCHWHRNPRASEPSTGLQKNSNTLCLNGQPLKADIAKALGIEVRLANDANCFALAEATLGAAKGAPVVMGLILGTGCGGGVVVNQHIIEGLHGIGGEWGHNRLPGETEPCYCGKSGCNEQVIAGPSLERYYERETGQKIRLPEICQRAASGETAAVATLERLRTKFAEAIAVVINILDPHAVVIGGGVGNIDLLYDEKTRAEVGKFVFNHEVRTAFLKPTLGDSAGVFGAAMLTVD